MKSLTSSSRYRKAVERILPFVPLVITLVLALCGGLWLFTDATIGNLISIIVNIGLDPLRAQMIAALVMTIGAALIGALVGRSKWGATVGAGIAFWSGYLVSFIHLERQPLRDPGGNLEPLNNGALVHTSIVMMALALIGAFIGSAIGVALAQVLLDPFFKLIVLAWRTRARTMQLVAVPAVKQGNRYRILSVIASWCGVAVMVTLLVLASGSGDFFIFSPDIGLHSVPHITSHLEQGIPSHGTVVDDTVLSATLGGQVKPFKVYLPPSYNTSQGQSKRYPTLYLLHGSPGHDDDWFKGGKADQSADTLIASGHIPELILISPDGNGRSKQTSEWGNSFDHKQLIENYVTNDLVRYVDLKYRTIANAAHRGIGGLSMGGFGAMNIAVHHPDVFGVVISLGGYYHAEGSIWGNNAAYMKANSPANTILDNKAAWKLHIYVGAATKDQPYYDYARQFVKELYGLHILYNLDIEKGYHSWRVWQVQLYNALLWLHWG